MRILITGAAGMIGSALADRLVRLQQDVIGFDNFNSYYSVEQKKENAKGFYCIDGDVTDGIDLKLAFSKHKPDVVVHLAAMANVRYAVGREAEYIHNNVDGTRAVLDACKEHGCNRIVFASTSSVYGKPKQTPILETHCTSNPLSAYPATKLTGELLGHVYHNLHGIQFTALRFFSVYGPRARPDMMPYMVTDRLMNGEPIQLYNGGSMWRDWTHVDDIVDGIVAAIDRPLGYKVMNLGSNRPVEMRRFVSILEDITGKNAIIEDVPSPTSEVDITCAHYGQAGYHLNYSPKVTIEDGLKTVVDWYKSCNPLASSV